jgi:hypothetical protein
MKLIYEIDSEKIQLSVDEALKILHIAITKEAYEGNGSCAAISPEPRALACTRGKYHKGFHIATGTELVYEIWKA